MFERNNLIVRACRELLHPRKTEESKNTNILFDLVENIYNIGMNKWHWYIYIIECLGDTYYTGMTWNIANRLEQHVSRLGSEYTKKHGVKKLVYYEEFNDLEMARNREKQIKNWSQEKKKKLINGEWKKEW